ncbi:MAG: tripartite tricarboxylate transporter TctB family protein [Rhodobacteraceae bacterium]|nr:tripartite tricarboxylate transporter TctB family protein [Paracoccaceae bacterium]
MRQVDSSSLIGGAIMIVAGAGVAIHAGTQLNLGTLQRMGPGLFPAVLGLMLATLGLLTVATAFGQARRAGRPEYGPALAVLGGLGVFALTIDRFGLLVAIPLLVIISSLASRRRRLVPLVVLTAGLCLAAWGIFVLGFNLPVRLLKWDP